MGSLEYLPKTPSPSPGALAGLEFGDCFPHQPWPPTSNIAPPPALEPYPSPRDSEGPSSSRSLLLGRRGRFCKGQIWGVGLRSYGVGAV